jgi:transcription elongation factor Elf1
MIMKLINGIKIFSLKINKRYNPDKCRHMKVELDEELALVTCGDCGERLDPLWILRRYADQETNLTWRIKELKDIKAKLDKKLRTKCEHCGRFTHVNV